MNALFTRKETAAIIGAMATLAVVGYGISRAIHGTVSAVMTHMM